MKFTDNLINKFGADKVLHYLVGLGFTSVALPYGLIVTIIMIILLIGLSFIKEEKLDDAPDMNDIFVCVLGILTSVILYVPKILFPFL